MSPGRSASAMVRTYFFVAYMADYYIEPSKWIGGRTNFIIYFSIRHGFTTFLEMDFFSLAVVIVYVLLSISLLVSLVRVIIGPSLPDRVVALDLISFVVISLIATYTISSGHPVYLDVAIVLALVAFLGTIAFARFVLIRAERHKKEETHV